jgi:hypothetical protein
MVATFRLKSAGAWTLIAERSNNKKNSRGVAKYRMQQRRSAEIADLADSVADYYFPDAWIDPEAIIHDVDITLSFNDYGDAFDGMLEWRPAGFHIFCNLHRVVNSTSDRARFTLGHELGHYFIDGHRNALQSGAAPSHPSFCCDTNPTLAVEQEANHFASHLLMPDSRIDSVLSPKRQRASVADVGLLEKAFKVSFQSAAQRVIRSARAPRCAGAMWKPNGKHWYVVSPAFEVEGYRFMHRQTDVLPPDCVTRMCLDSDVTPHAVLKGVTTAAFWFTGVSQGSMRDIVLCEEAIRLGPYGVFTFLGPLDI